MIGTATSVIRWTYIPETTTAVNWPSWRCWHCQTMNSQWTHQCVGCGVYKTSAAPKPPPCIFSAIIKEWATPEEDEAWASLAANA